MKTWLERYILTWDRGTVREYTITRWKFYYGRGGIPYESERVVLIKFKEHVIGNLRIDMIIDNTTILEFKIIKSLNEAAECQARNYLHLTGLKTAYLVNYPPYRNREVEIRKIEAEPLGGGPVLDSGRTVEILGTEPLGSLEFHEGVPAPDQEES